MENELTYCKYCQKEHDECMEDYCDCDTVGAKKCDAHWQKRKLEREAEDGLDGMKFAGYNQCDGTPRYVKDENYDDDR